MPTIAWFDFNRRAASALTPWLAKTPFTASHVTTLCLGAGLWAGYFFSTGRRMGLFLGALFLELSVVLGHCGDELARGKSMSIPASAYAGRRRYSILAGAMTDFACWSGLALGAVSLGVPGEAIRGWWLAAMIGAAIRIRQTAQGGSNLSTVRTLAAYVFALIGSPWLFLIAGAVGTNVLWVRSWAQSRGIKIP